MLVNSIGTTSLSRFKVEAASLVSAFKLEVDHRTCSFVPRDQRLHGRMGVFHLMRQ